jgi:hypothetical protein
MSEKPTRVVIPRYWDHDLHAKCDDKNKLTFADVGQWLDGLPRVPEPEQRACVGCRFAWATDTPKPFCQLDGMKNPMAGNQRQPYLGLWDPQTQACPGWQPRRDKAEELADWLMGFVNPDCDRRQVKESFLERLREAGIGGESDE